MASLERGLLFTVFAVAGIVFAACSGGAGSSGSSLPPAQTNNTVTQPATGTQLLYVPISIFVQAGFPIPEVAAFSLNAHGNTSPVATLRGSNTQLGPPSGVAFDSHGLLYVSDFVNNCIRVYSSLGNVAPTRNICGPQTQLQGPDGLALDRSDNIYVSNIRGNDITIYATGSNGNVAPQAVISGAQTGIMTPTGVAVDQSGTIYVANLNGGTACPAGTVTSYASGSSGNVAPKSTLLVPTPTGVTFDPNGDEVISSQPKSLLFFAPGASGNAMPFRTISGGSTMLEGPSTPAFDSTGTIYVANEFNASNVNSSLVEFSANASGDVAPIRVISGPAADMGPLSQLGSPAVH